MFSMLPTPIHTHTQSHHHYTPVHPSPLSSSPLRPSPTPSPLSQRDPNVQTSSPTRTPFCFSNHQAPNPMMSPTPTPKARSPARLPSPAPTPTSGGPREGNVVDGAGSRESTGKEIPFSRRPTKANPLMHRDAKEGRETRRKLFLKRVRDSSSEKRYGGEEEMMRRIWVAEERRWEEERRAEAMGVEVRAEDAYEDIESGYGDEDLVEEVARDEAEWEAFLGMMEEQSQQGQNQHEQEHGDTPYGSDDEEYDDIFMDVILEESRTASQLQQEQEQQSQHEGQSNADIDMMDMS